MMLDMIATPNTVYWPLKEPISVLDFSFDVSAQLLAAGDTVIGASLSCAPWGTDEIQIVSFYLTASATLANGLMVVWLAGGMPGRLYTFDLCVSTASGRVWEWRLRLQIDPACAPFPSLPLNPGFSARLVWGGTPAGQSLSQSIASRSQVTTTLTGVVTAALSQSIASSSRLTTNLTLLTASALALEDSAGDLALEDNSGVLALETGSQTAAAALSQSVVSVSLLQTTLGTAGAATFDVQLEDGSGDVLLEDSSGYLILES